MNRHQTAPWLIPPDAQQQLQIKHGYHQVKYTWRQDGWCYEARWHERIPTAKLITWPSWRLDRIRPGIGYGPHAQPRLAETRVGNCWLPLRRVRYAAARYNHGQATVEDIRLLKAAHPAPVTKSFPGK